MKTLELTIGERLSLVTVINGNGQNMSLSMMKDALKVIEKVSIEEEEKAKVGFEVKADQISWKDTAYSIKVEFNDDEVKLLKEMFEKRDKDKGYNLAEGLNMISLVEKIEAK